MRGAFSDLLNLASGINDYLHLLFESFGPHELHAYSLFFLCSIYEDGWVDRYSNRFRDRSYMPDLSQNYCSGAFILHHTDSQEETRANFVDESLETDNYQGEPFGIIFN